MYFDFGLSRNLAISMCFAAAKFGIFGFFASLKCALRCDIPLNLNSVIVDIITRNCYCLT